MFHQFRTIFQYELKYWLKSPAFYIYILLPFLMMWMMISDMSVERSHQWSGRVMYSPMYVYTMWKTLRIFVFMVLPAIVGLSMYRDYRNGVHHLLYAYPMTKKSYLSAKFLSGVVVVTLVIMLMGLGFYLGTIMPWANPTTIGVWNSATFWQPFFWMILPNVLFVSAVVFAVVTFSRNIYAGFISMLILLILQVGLGNVLAGLEEAYWGALLDPFGEAAINYYAGYWTVAEQNERLLPIQGWVIYNRLFWLGITALLGGFLYWKFDFEQEHSSLFYKKTNILPSSTGAEIAYLSKITKVNLPKVNFDFSFLQQLKTTWQLSNLDFRYIATSLPFLALVAVGLSFLVFMVSSGAIRYDTENLPLTRMVLDTPLYLFSAMINLVTFLYAGLLIHRAKMANAHQLVDVSPVSNWVLLASKFIAIIKVQVLLLSLLMVGGMLVQISKGYFHFEISLYLFELFGINLIHFAIWAMLAMLIQTIIPNPYVGFFFLLFAPVAMIGLMEVGPKIGLAFFEQNVFRYNQGPGMIFGLPYSDMNGYGSILKPYFVYKLYWMMAGMLLLLGALLMWVRGLPHSFLERLSIAKFRMKGRLVIGIVVLLIGFISLGATIYYESNILNQHFSRQDQRDLLTKAVIKYQHYRKTPQPKIVSVNIHLNLFPEDNSLQSKGTYLLVNETDKVLDTLVINYEAGLHHSYTFDQATKVISKEKIADLAHFDILKIEKGLAPGDSLKMDFALQGAPSTWLRANDEVKSSGTFIRDNHFPRFGFWLDYVRGQLQMNVNIEKPHPHDSLAIHELHATKDSDRIDFEATISTSLDQIALAPGYLQKEWVGEYEMSPYGKRRFFHYKMDKKIAHSFMFVSGKYKVLRDQWKDIKLEIYYHPEHEYNVHRMMEGMKASLIYNSENFSPYQFKQIRIAEFAQVGSASAHGFPNLIPYGEEAGFIADIDDSEDGGIDFAFGGAVHEVAHQWWGHQVGSADALGSKMSSESMAEYVTLMVRKHEKGIDKARLYLKHSMDKYLQGRSRERSIERPLALGDPSQAYIHYAKGVLAFYALSEYLGEAKLNRAIQSYVEKVAFLEGEEYTTALELVDFIKKATPDSLQYMIKDWFETVTLYDSKMLSAQTTKLPNGKYQVDMEFLVSKYRSVGKGEKVFQDETGDSITYQSAEMDVPMYSLPLADYLEIGVFGKDGKELYLEKHRFEQIDNRLSVVVDALPVEVGVDPYHVMVDGVREDNWVGVE